MQQYHLKTIDVHFKCNDAFTVLIIKEQLQQLATKTNMPTGINTCNNMDYDVIEMPSSQRQHVP